MNTQSSIKSKKSSLGLHLSEDYEDTIMMKKGEQKHSGRHMRPHHTIEQYEDPLEILIKDHEECEKYLAQMRNAVESIRMTGFSAEAFRQIAEAIQFIDTDVRQHNELEEKCLFPVIERHGLNSPVLMLSEHREMWSAFNLLLKHVQDIEEGRLHGTSIVDLIKDSEFIIELLTNHIMEENNVLFPKVKQLLTQDEYRQFTQEINSSVPHSD